MKAKPIKRSDLAPADLIFSACRESGATLLLVTHDAALAAQCPQIMHLAAGRISGTAPMPRAAVS